MSAIRTIRPLHFVWETADPFLFCVHHRDAYPRGDGRFGPAASLAGRRIGQDFDGKDGWNMYHGQTVPGFPSHPHRGFETVTLVRRGFIDHSDSLGAAGRFGAGDAQWMTAGGGVVHSEMFPLLDTEGPNPVELFQLWLNLPRRSKMVRPHYTMLWKEAIPVVEHRDAAGARAVITVLAGALGDARPPAPPPDSWAADAAADIAIWTVKLDPGARWTLPAAQAGTNRTVYGFDGTVQLGGQGIPARSGVRVDPVALEVVAGPEGAELLVLQGRPIGEPVVQYGPFVMNTAEEIQQAFADYQKTRFGGWPWPADDPVHGGERRRFARHADGREETPIG